MVETSWLCEEDFVGQVEEAHLHSPLAENSSQNHDHAMTVIDKQPPQHRCSSRSRTITLPSTTDLPA
eukprot:scaffold30528_cov61-Cyclotella_meneghiniana.AAC.5